MWRRLLILVTLVCASARGWAQDDADEEQRRAIRGKPVRRATVDPLLEDQRRFEEEAFRDRQSRATDRPEDLRPDLPWLKGLETGDIPVRWDSRVIQFLEFYRDDPRGRTIMTSWLRAQGRFRDLIVAALRKNGLPEDLLYVAMIESSYDPRDRSRVGAAGLWQFMPAGGRIYGLTQSYWVDERNDPEKANEAAMGYWKDLYERFNNWHLSLAAFNCGYGAVLKSMAKYNTNDFWALLELEGGLPWESSVYVPKALAASLVGRNRAAFGYDTVVPDPPWEFDRVTVPKSVELSVIARAAGCDVQTIRDLNPELLRNRTPAGARDYPVRVPKGAAARFRAALDELRGEWEPYDAYAIRHGERFEDVARAYGVAPKRLRELNDVQDLTEVRGGTALVVPAIDAATLAQNRKAAEHDLYHSDVVPGEADEALLVPVPDKSFTVEGKKRVFYRVVAGDTLGEVARAFGVTVAELAGWNALDAQSAIAARMVLQVFVPLDFDPEERHVSLLDEMRLLVVTSGSPEHLDVYERRKGRERLTYVVKPGDTWESIGRKFKLTKYDVARINRRGYTSPPVPGEELIVYKIVDRSKAQKTGVYKNIPRPKGQARRAKRTRK